ncbi:damage-inducible protein DinB [Paramagnetospirillum kuznetsovii]|uniref:Damage-inducible protein DinB n=1 Tax=Paramagnetospirillum kuznetsovii TaxID=2053833 RepID=A0A364NX89_9PROT|nr:DinB family protein [Paramagnetospirillum kuznetsovii]RAU21682.1 damage-inducible protein DinB [Paramagnetospirillum kuznetsovii]
MTPATLRTLARYNAWANQRLYEACSRLPGEAISCPRPSFFGSILATLNHVLIGDMLWMGRFTGDESHGIKGLDQILHADFGRLVQARQDMDARIVTFFEAPLGDLEAVFAYRTAAGQDTATPRGLTMLHMFNHATHHRGQVHDMLSATDVPPPALDLVYFLRE